MYIISIHMAAVETGTDTSYPILIPSGSDNADIQSALRLISYGIPGTPTSDNQITANSIFGKMSLLAPKASPAFTGSGSITGNFSVGGNLTVTGTLNTLVGASSIFEDKNLILNGNPSTPSTDVLADGGGLSINGLTVKSFTFSNGVGWNSSENLNLVTGKTFKINGTDVLSSNAVLGILGTNIAKKDSANAFTGANTFSGATQTINGITIDTNGGISRNLINNEWSPIVTHSPYSPVTYYYSTVSRLGSRQTGSMTVFVYDNNGDIVPQSVPIVVDRWAFTYNGDAPLTTSQTGPTVYVSSPFLYAYDTNGVSLYNNHTWTIFQDAPQGVIYLESPEYVPYFTYYNTGRQYAEVYPGGTIYDYYDTTIAKWNFNGYNGSTQAQITSIGTVEALNGFVNIGKDYHTNSGVPYFNVGLSASTDKIFSVTTGLTAPWENIAVSANATKATASKWYATGFTAKSATGNMTYSLSNGIGSVEVVQSGVYNIAAALTMGESVAGNLIGLFIIESNGTVNAPFAVSGGASSGSTVNISSVKYLSSGQKIGLAVYNGNATAVATDLSVTATNYTSVKLSGFLVG